MHSNGRLRIIRTLVLTAVAGATAYAGPIAVIDQQNTSSGALWPRAC